MRPKFLALSALCEPNPIERGEEVRKKRRKRWRESGSHSLRPTALKMVVGFLKRRSIAK
tara:strand:+ start:317 stop:493 length:177 start_codon:yes stop_codon:yes gene_type:complete